MTNILITNAYSWYNKGDAGIVLGMIKALDEVFNDPTYTVLSFTPDVDDQRYPVDARFLDDPLGVRFNSDRFNKIRIPFRALGTLVSASIDADFGNPTLEAYREADLVLACGGGYLGGHSVVSLTHVYSIWLADLFDKDYYIFSQSINNMPSPLVKIPTKHVLNRAEHVFPREQISESYLDELGVTAPVTLIPDSAFMLKPKGTPSVANEVADEIEGDLLFGVTAREWSFPEQERPKEQMEKYVSSFVGTIDRLVSQHDAEIVFFPQVMFEPHDDDRKISERIASRCTHSDRVHVLTDDYTPRELISLAGSCDLFLGTRMHSNIFSLVAGTPTGGISYQPKTDGIMKMVGLGDYTVPIANLTVEKLYTLAESLMSDREEISGTISSRIPELRQEILAEVEAISEAYSDSPETSASN